MKKTKIAFLLLPILLLSSCANNPLPKAAPEGLFGIDANINHETIDKYLDRSDCVYRDVRLLEDPADYEAIGGDRFLSGFVRGFEVAPLPYFIPLAGMLPPQIGESYTGPTLFKIVNDQYIANYKESLDILKYLFPQDKNVLLMCGGAGYAGMTRDLLIALGWNEDTVYNVGGYWYYEGVNKVEVKRVDENDNVVYDFYKVAYHDIDFSSLNAV
ncbi:MAG: hypothetical protein RBR85_00925 [Bacilli bacterium]|jgi:hypothetical protein|nr:hypothetical protein [Bacilli bacterium]